MSPIAHSVDTDMILESTFSKYKRVVGETSRPNEALSRCFINLMVFQCLLDEHATPQTNPSVSTSESSMSRPRPNTPPTKGDVDSPAPMSLFLESQLKQLVTFRGKQFLLSGIADYSLGYKANDTITNNLIVVEAKKRWGMEAAYGQLLSYMGLLYS